MNVYGVLGYSTQAPIIVVNIPVVSIEVGIVVEVIEEPAPRL